MSDEEEITETESEQDFSASEDEWVPDKRTKPSISSSDELDGEDVEDVFVSKSKLKQSKPPANRRGAKKPAAKSRAPKAPAKASASKPVANVDDDESNSSGDDCLVDPSKLDFNSDFFAAGCSTRPPPVQARKDVKPSNSENDVDDDFVEPNTNVQSFKQHEEFITNLERAKAHLANVSATNSAEASTSGAATVVDIGQLLQMGESKPSTSGVESNGRAAPVPASTSNSKSIKSREKRANSDSDWEEVADTRTTSMRPDEVVTTIRVGPELKPKPNRTQLELEAQIKRALNRRRKETQLLMHNVHVLCWIGHGNYVNAVLNEPHLMQMGLQFMPSKSMYPKERTDRTYFEQISKWYASQMRLKGTEPDVALSRLPALPISLALQLRSRTAISKNAFVMMFIVLLRAIGVQCRLVLNLATVPLRPPASELCSLSQNGKKEVETKATVKKEVAKSTVKTGANGKMKEEVEKATVKKEVAKSTVKTVAKSSDSKSKPDLNALKKDVDSVRSHDNGIDGSKSARCTTHLDAKNSNGHKTELDVKKSTTNDNKSSTNTAAASSSKSATKSTEISTSTRPQRKPTASRSETKTSTTVSPHFPVANSKTAQRSTKSNTAESSTKSTSSRKRPHVSAENASTAPGAPGTQSPHFAKTTTAANVLPFGSPISKRTRSRPKRAADLPHLPQLDGADDGRRSSTRKRVSAARTKAAAASDESSGDSSEDSDFHCSPQKKIAAVAKKRAPAKSAKKTNRNKAQSAVDRVKSTAKRIDRRLVSTDDDDDGSTTKPGKAGMNMWVEVYSEAQEQWMCIDLFKLKVHCVDTIRAAATRPLSYVLAWNNDSTVRDVSARYCTNWNTTTRRQRTDADWLSAALRSFRERATFRTRTEDLELDKLHVKEPLPTAIGEFKNHPLYALHRHLLKFEGIYPPDAPALGFIRGEQVYARACVHTLHSRDIWLKSALVVRPGETAYKVVKARPKWDRQTNRVLESQPLEIFGHWQTQAYDPPTAENGIVPRNAYGNVELFKPEMLPKKTVHLQLPGLNRTCRKMKIDCAPAVVGFDFHSGNCHPEFDGFIVCEEFAVEVETQYWIDQEEAQRRVDEKYEARVYGNWKKLIKGLLIRQRLQKKYKFADTEAKTEEKGKARRK